MWEHDRIHLTVLEGTGSVDVLYSLYRPMQGRCTEGALSSFKDSHWFLKFHVKAYSSINIIMGQLLDNYQFGVKKFPKKYAEMKKMTYQ